MYVILPPFIYERSMYQTHIVNFTLQIRDNAEQAVRNLLRNVAKDIKEPVLSAIDYLDDGTPIQLTVTIDAQKGSAIFDFKGTGPEMIGSSSL